MPFRDRTEAGARLAHALREYADKPDTIVIALPRGGVVVGHAVAQALHLPLDIVCPRKIGAPGNEEYAIGAITETGEGVFTRPVDVSEEYLKAHIAEEARKAKWRLDSYRAGRAPRDLKNRRVLLIDDGLATGSTMRAAVRTVRAEAASEIVLAVPVAPPETLQSFKNEVERVVCLEAPENFFAVGQFYDDFTQTTDEDVIALLRAASAGEQNKRA